MPEHLVPETDISRMFDIINDTIDKANAALPGSKDSTGKINGDITGDAATVNGKKADGTAGNIPLLDRDGKLPLGVMPAIGNGSPGVTNYIANGGKVASVSGLTITHGAIEASISGVTVKRDAGDQQTVGAKRHGLLTIAKDGTRGIRYADDPTTFIDDNTVLMYKPDGSVTCSNLAVGKSKIAVANDLTRQGGILPVAGLFGGDAAQGDGTSGFYNSANSAGFPTGANPREIAVCLTFYPTSSNAEMFAAYGAAGGTQEFGLGKTDYGTLALTDYTNFNTNDSKFAPEVGKTYLLNLLYDGANALIYTNGSQIQKMAYSLNTVAGILRVACDLDASRKTKSVIHFIELRNACRTPQQISEMANRLCLPCSYSQSFPCEIIAGKTYYDVATIGNAISGGDFSGYPKSLAFDKNDSTSAYWGSVQTGSGVVGVAYIGQKTDYKIRKIRHLNYNGTNGNLSSIKIQWTYDGVTWIDIQTQAMPKTAATMTEFDVADYPAVGTHFIRELANSAADGGASFDVAELRMFTDDNPQMTRNITATLTASTISSLYFRSGASSVLTYNDADWQYGRREKAFGGNRRVFLGWKPFSGSVTLAWGNPFGTRKIDDEYVWAQDTNGTNETACLSYDGGNNRGVQVNVTPSQRLRISTGTNGVVVFNGANQATGYIGCYAEVLEDD